MQHARVELLYRRAIGPRGIETQLTAVADHLRDRPCEFGNRGADADTEIDWLDAVVLSHRTYAGIGEIVHVNELPPRLARSPDLDRRLSCRSRIVQTAQQRAHDMRVVDRE